MAEISKDLFDALIKQQINLSRYGNKQAADMVSLLNTANKEIVAKILARGADKSFTSRRLNALLAELQQIIAGTYSEAADTLKSEMASFAEHSAEVAGGMLAMEMPLKWSPVKMSAEQLAAIMDKTPIRIGVDKSLLFDELFKSLAGGMEEKVRGALRLSMVEGESVHDMVKRLEGTAANRFKDGVLEGPRRDLYNLTHSVVQHVNNQAAQATMANNSEVLKGWTYMATFDSKTCSVCFSFSGKTFPLGQGPIPALHISCRCYQAPLVKSWKELGFDNVPEYPTGTRATSTGVVKADLSFNDWLKDQPRRTQDELLGPTRGKMFADGKIKLDRFTDASGKLYTLGQLKKR